jgi:hypothetical protein
MCAFQINTPSLYKNNQCETHKNEFRASIKGTANAFLWFDDLFEVNYIKWNNEFEIAILELPNVILFPDMYTKFVTITSIRNFVILWSQIVSYCLSNFILSIWKLKNIYTLCIHKDYVKI